MSQECRNDCIEKLMFPRTINNRPGLSRIDYRIGSYSRIREALLRRLNTDPILTDWTHREPDDPGIALLEGAAVLGDILTFYQDLYANEAYLRTAKWRESVADLVRLTGYLLSPGVGGKAAFAVEVKEDKDKLNKPVTISKGTPIKAQVSGLTKAADFETTQTISAYPKLSKFNLYRPLYIPYITGNTKEFFISLPDQETTPVKLVEGDRLLIGSADPAVNPTRLLDSEIIVIDKVSQLHGHNIYKMKGSLKGNWNTYTITAFKLGRNFRHFGHNTPLKFTHTVNDTVKLEDQLFSRPLDVKTQAITTSTTLINNDKGVRILEPELSALEFPLDSQVDDLAVGSQIITRGLFYKSTVSKEFTLINIIDKITAISMTWGTVSGSSSLVTMKNSLSTTESSDTYNVADIRYFQFHEVLGPMLTLCAAPQVTPQLRGKYLYFHGTEAEVRPLEKRQLIFEKPGETPITANVAAVQKLAAVLDKRKMLRMVTLDTEVAYSYFPNEKAIVDVYGNLVSADQGKSENETVLGNGDNREKFQSFKLPKAPLTYHLQSAETPPEVPELEVYVDDRLWTQVPVFFNRGPKEEIYIVREDADGNSWVQFGDGKTGARLPSGIDNVTAVYRTGTGAYGTLKEGTKPQAGGKVERLDKVHMPLAASGGAEAEKGDNARETAPGKTQGLGRLVSLKDYESEAQAIAGVSKAFAAWEVSAKESTVRLTLLMESGRSSEFTEVSAILNKYNICRGPQRFPVTVVQGKRSYIYIHAEYALDPSYKVKKVEAAIKEALGVYGAELDGIDGEDGLFGSRRRRFGQNAYVSRIKGVINNVEGVLWARVKALETLGDADEPALLSTPAAPGYSAVLSCSDLRIFCLYKTHLKLSVAKEDTAGRC